MVYLQFMKSRVNRKLRLLKALCQFLIVGFEDGCFVQILPRIIVFHSRSSLESRNRSTLPIGADTLKERIFGLASSRIGLRGHCRSGSFARRFVNFLKEPSPSQASTEGSEK
jgi:hypothetical protein